MCFLHDHGALVIVGDFCLFAVLIAAKQTYDGESPLAHFHMVGILQFMFLT